MIADKLLVAMLLANSYYYVSSTLPSSGFTYTLEDGYPKNYASPECAKVVETNPEANKASNIISVAIDDYMLNPCKKKIWFVIELCESIQATHIEIANYELFSSMPKDFTVYFSDIYPALDWKLVGQFTAADSRTLQTFDLNQVGFGKFIRVELHSHYGNEHYCPISEVKVYGASMEDAYKKSENLVDTSLEEQNKIKLANKKSKRRTSAYRVYHSMMIEPHICGLCRSIDKNDSDTGTITTQQLKEQPLNLNQQQKPQPTQQPAVNRTTVLKPSIFVELSNKVKAIETSLRLQKEDMERRLNETEMKFEKFALETKSSFCRVTALFMSYLVYKMFLDYVL